MVTTWVSVTMKLGSSSCCDVMGVLKVVQAHVGDVYHEYHKDQEPYYATAAV